MLFRRTWVGQASAGVNVMAMLPVVVVVAEVAVLAVLAGCGGDSEATTTTSSSSISEAAPTITTTLTPEAEVEQAYLAFEDMFTRLRENPNPDDPEITERTTGQTRDGIIDSQTTMKTLGERAAFGPKDVVTVLNVTFRNVDTAVVTSCAVEDITITNAVGGRLGPRVTTYWTDYTLSRIDGGWVVSYSTAIKKRAGEQACAG